MIITFRSVSCEGVAQWHMPLVVFGGEVELTTPLSPFPRGFDTALHTSLLHLLLAYGSPHA